MVSRARFRYLSFDRIINYQLLTMKQRHGEVDCFTAVYVLNSPIHSVVSFLSSFTTSCCDEGVCSIAHLLRNRVIKSTTLTPSTEKRRDG
jgi:hypothetical protein